MNDLELGQFLLALVALLGAGHLGGYLFQRFGLPRVIGEIAGGIVVGNSILGAMAPTVHAWLFQGYADAPKLFSAFYWIGLILLMFTSGFSVEKTLEPTDRRIIITLIVGTTLFPFMAGWGLSMNLDMARHVGTAGNPVAFAFVVAVAVAVTSIPVISRIFADLGILEHRFAKIVLSTAVAHDVILWAILSVATGLVAVGQPTPGTILGIVAKTIVFFGVAALAGPWLLYRLTRTRYNLIRKASPIGWVLMICFLMAWFATLLQVNVIFGALLAGILFGLTGDPEIVDVKNRITDFSFAVFVPFYFAMVGFKLKFGSSFDPLFALGFILFCTICQLGATIVSAWLAKCTLRTSIDLGMAMNARGGPGIVLATIAFEYGIVNEDFHVTLLLLAIITSLAAGWWLRYRIAQPAPLFALRPDATKTAGP